ncbi:unnamed protein product [Knipowitschia caucasica]
MTETFIRVRAENDVLFTGATFSASTSRRTILEKLDLQEVATPLQEVATPLQEVVTPLQGVATPLQEVATPLQEVATPLQEVATPLQEVATPLQEVVTPLQARKKWDNLKKKYKDCKCPGTGQGVEGNPTAGTWPWFGLMDEVSGRSRPSTLLS